MKPLRLLASIAVSAFLVFILVYAYELYLSNYASIASLNCGSAGIFKACTSRAEYLSIIQQMSLKSESRNIIIVFGALILMGPIYLIGRRLFPNTK